MTFADILKAEMTAQGISVQALARDLEVSTMSVSKWRGGRYEPGMRLAVRLARRLGMSVEALAQ